MKREPSYTRLFSHTDRLPDGAKKSENPPLLRQDFIMHTETLRYSNKNEY